jgi:hypothetical protein
VTSEEERWIRDVLDEQADAVEARSDLARSVRRRVRGRRGRQVLQVVGAAALSVGVFAAIWTTVPRADVTAQHRDPITVTFAPRPASPTPDGRPSLTKASGGIDGTGGTESQSAEDSAGARRGILLGHWELTPRTSLKAPHLVSAFITFTGTGQVTLHIGGCGQVSGRFQVSDLHGVAPTSSFRRRADDLTGRIAIDVSEPPPTCTVTVAEGKYLPPSPDRLLDRLRSARTFAFDGEFLTLRNAGGISLSTGPRSRVARPPDATARSPAPGGPTAGPDTPVPDVMGLGPEQALKALAAAGFRTAQHRVQLTDGTANPCDGATDEAFRPEVLGVVPAVGHTLPPGEVVQLFVYEGPGVDLVSC